MVIDLLLIQAVEAGPSTFKKQDFMSRYIKSGRERSHQSQLRIVYRDLKTDLDDCEVVFTMLDAHGWREIVGEARLREMDNIAQYRKMLMGQQKELMRAGEELQKKPSILPPPELPRDYMKLESYEEEKRSKSEERPPVTRRMSDKEDPINDEDKRKARTKQFQSLKEQVAKANKESVRITDKHNNRAKTPEMEMTEEDLAKEKGRSSP